MTNLSDGAMRKNQADENKVRLGEHLSSPLFQRVDLTRDLGLLERVELCVIQSFLFERAKHCLESLRISDV